MESGWGGTNQHIPVLLDAVLSYLRVRPDGIYLDCTVGLGGHASALQELLSPNGQLIGLDGDKEAVKHCRLRLSPSCHLVHAPYDTFPTHLVELGIKQVDGMLIDLGISSYQLDTAGRGFSYRNDGPLDMRFDVDAPISARDIVTGWSKDQLRKLFREYGEERRASAIAAAVVDTRGKKAIESTGQLAQIIESVVGTHASTKTLSRIFQAIRIAVNDELGALKRFMESFIDYLSVGGRLVVISYHSLEDRLVKRTFRRLEKGCTCPPDVPVCRCGLTPSLELLTKRVVRPPEAEVASNPRARSARLRAAEKI